MANVVFLRKKNRGRKTSKKGSKIAAAAKRHVEKREAKNNGQRNGGEKYIPPRYR